jgi:hypothetical protein
MSHVPGRVVRVEVFTHHGMWILFQRRLLHVHKGWRGRVHRFDEGVTWWRPGVELRAQQVIEALR